jgi:GNAT superfamily N-acetyltransferase
MPDDEIQRELEFSLCDFADLDQYSEIFEACFGRTVGRRYFEWKYRQCPTGQVVAFQATHRGRVAAWYGLLPEQWTIGGAERLVYQSMDTMTHPDYQRRGLFSKLARMTYEHVGTQPDPYVMVGVPGPMSASGFDKLTWKRVGEYGAMFTAKPAVAFARRRNGDRSVTTRRPLEVTPVLNDFLTSARLDGAAATHFSGEFFQWRVFDSPARSSVVITAGRNNEIEGFVVGFRDHAGWAVVQCLHVTNADRYRPLTPILIDELMDTLGASKTYAWKPRTEHRLHALRATGFVENPTGKGPLTYKQPIISFTNIDDWSVNGVALDRETSFDFQPIMQD